MKRVLCLLLLFAGPASAQRSLHWRDVNVVARLDEEGTLRVVETQTMVFTGDWNGGERRFDVRPRQRFRFIGMQRLDSMGVAHAMREGDLGEVDEFAFTEARTLRWRSRLPSDPPFSETAITYMIEYVLSNILVPEGETFILNHDFGFANRAGAIENVTVQLELNSDWQPTTAYSGTWQGRNLPPGEGFVVRVPMRYFGSKVPEVSTGAAPIERAILALVSLLLIASFGRRLYDRERATGRLDQLPSPTGIDQKWIEDHLFTHLPEVVGAAWDNSTGESEVAAVLARLCGDGRMKSEVQPGGMFKEPALHLELLVDRDRFHGHERRLVDALFESDERTTDTARIKDRYKKSGFDPAERIRKPLGELVKGLTPGKAPSKPPALPSLLAFLGAVALLITAVGREPADAPVVFIGGAVMVVCYFVAVGGAAAWRNRVYDVGAAAAWFLVPLGIALAGLLVLLASGFTQATALALAGLSLLFAAFANSVFNQARTRENQERIALRRRLAVARQYFIEELRRDTPRLQDSWFPYLIAFGLGKHMDKWFRAFGGETQPAIVHSGHSSGSGGGSSGSGGGWTGFGGGGGFSGGGASASWAAAAGSMAAGISAPSSSSGGSSGGGGGGGGSSGGGGGGGW